VPSEWSQFAEQHWVVGGIVASLMWFLAGRQTLAKGKPDAAIAWQCVAVFVILTTCGWAAVKGEWLGLTFAIAVLYLEVRSIRRISATKRSGLQ
jgi:hypothetical protein